jgi:hypothetical protein
MRILEAREGARIDRATETDSPLKIRSNPPAPGLLLQNIVDGIPLVR